MRIKELEKMREHMLAHFDSVQGLGETLRVYKENKKISTYLAGVNMVQTGCFDCYYSQALNTLAELYGKDFDDSRYLTKNGNLRYKNGEVYAWTIYKHKVGMTLENMEKKGEFNI